MHNQLERLPSWPNRIALALLACIFVFHELNYTNWTGEIAAVLLVFGFVFWLWARSGWAAEVLYAWLGIVALSALQAFAWP